MTPPDWQGHRSRAKLSLRPKHDNSLSGKLTFPLWLEHPGAARSTLFSCGTNLGPSQEPEIAQFFADSQPVAFLIEGWTGPGA